MATIHLMVLNDGETFTDLRGCKIVSLDTSVVGDAFEDWECSVKEVCFRENEVEGVSVVVEYNT